MRPLSPPPLSEKAREQLTQDLQKYRRRLASRQLASIAASPETAGSEPLVTQYLMDVAREFMDSAANSRPTCLEHWGELFSILRIRSTAPTGEHRRAARRNLAAGLLFLAADREERFTVETELDAFGRMLDTRSGAWIRPPFAPDAPLGATAKDGVITLREIDRPAADGIVLEQCDKMAQKVPRLGATQILLFDDPAALGIPVSAAVKSPTEFQSFVDSVKQAMDVLSSLAPLWRDWIASLVPALVYMGAPPPKSDSRSESYGAGFPICLSHVRDPMRHAEDLVHECQHHRFHLWAQDVAWDSLGLHTCEFVSPYRGDPRPLSGLHLGLHAFTAVNAFRLDAIDTGLIGKIQFGALLRTHCANLFAWSTLMDFETAGGEVARYLNEVAAELVRHHAAIRTLMPDMAFREIQQHFSEHIEQVSQQCGGARNNAPVYTNWDAIVEAAKRRTRSNI